MDIVKSFKNLTRFEIGLWAFSVLAVSMSGLVGGSENILTMIASLIGVTALIFVAKGDVFGQILIVIFSVFYGIISFKFRYFGEMITYLGMTAPIACLAVISWLRHPFEGKKQEVEVTHLKRGEIVFMLVSSVLVTAVFYFILSYFNTANIIPSTISVTTSYIASYLTYRRSAFYALAYAMNDLVLIVLWTLASITDIRYLAMVICFLMFFINDMYGFVSWSKMEKRQSKAKQKAN